MRLTVKQEDMKNLIQDLGILSMDTANQVEFSLATRVFSKEKVACQARITTANEQIIPLFYAQTVDDEVESEIFVVSAKLFSGLAGNLLSYNQDITFDTDCVKSGKVYLRVGNNVEIPLEVISQGSQITPIVMGKDEPVFLQVTVSTEEFKKAARGASFADEKNSGGLENTQIFLDLETGSMQFLSSDRFIVGRTKMNVIVPESNEKTKDRIKEMDEALGKYCETTKQSKRELLMLIPARSFVNLQKVVGGTEKFILASDSKHIFVAAGNKVYTLTKGAVKIGLKDIYESFSKFSYPVAFTVKYGEFVQAVSSLSKVISLKALKNTPICISVEQNSVKISICGSEESGAISVQADTSGTGEIYLSAEKMERVLAGLDSSKQICVWFGNEKQAVRVANGKLSDTSADDLIYVIPIKAPAKVADEKEHKEEQNVTTE